MTVERPETEAQLETEVDLPIPVTRRRIDHLLIGAGFAVAVVLVVAGGLLTWGNDFAEDYVSDELTSQKITFPPAEALQAQGREDLVPFAGEQVSTGEEAEAYASYIDGHLEETAGGLTYAEVPDREAQAAVQEATESGAPESEIAELQAEADELTAQRDSLFRGEMLRGALLNAFAWSTMGRIAGIAATVAFVGAAFMALLSVAGVQHLRKVTVH
jgi:hypothetical protein